MSQPKFAMIRSLALALLAFAVLAAIFNYWNEHSKPNDSINHLAQLEQMEKEGVPPFHAKQLDGSELQLESLHGKVVILNFWASWCGPCVQEVPSLIELVAASGGALELVAVSGDSSREEIDAFLKSFPKMHGAHIHLIWDEDHSIMRQYGVERLPESFLLGTDGKLVKKIVGSIDWHTPDSEKYIQQLSK